jgi:hypothetical protein
MIRTKIFLLIGIIAVFFSCGKIDNYDKPNGDIYGKLTDVMANEGLQSEQPNGFSIKLFEKGSNMNSPIITQGKTDGTYENALIFQNEYKVIPCEGAFFPLDTAIVNVGAHTEVNFDVTPFLAVTNVTVTPGAGKVTAMYNIERDRVGDKIVERKTLVSSIPTVNNVVFDFKNETPLSLIDDNVILATSYTDEITGLTPGKSYNVRICVRTNNPLKRYNYSKIFAVTIP